MARAKRTNRAEARRRYRAAMGEEPESFDLEDEAQSDVTPESAASAAGRSRTRAAATPSPTQPARPSVMGAFRAAFRPTDFRGDFAALPRLLRNRAFLIPLAMIVGAAVLIAVTGGTEPISRALSPYFLAPPPVAPVFLAGFLAPRASWLIGGLLGIISSISIFAILSTPAMQQVATGATAATALSPDVYVYSFFVATVGGGFYAAAAAWYKRFLALASPSRAARAAAKPAGQSRKRGPDDRPMLARRR